MKRFQALSALFDLVRLRLSRLTISSQSLPKRSYVKRCGIPLVLSLD
ncbi:hypothetical protein SAMCFNEI73_Ch2634 [Sinorhizobium americanum]|uniref:Uncharacterized protein n=1 Tax=Sinorhizobium americanum TaxID=194963 RepID=A0A1L3LP89_9HYPH|nr:hypothetical protein SAMCFNEI73_Ch2634 [Sinorhizobium americanum]